MNAIETRSLRKVYPAPAVKKKRGVPAPPAPPSAREFSMPIHGRGNPN